MNRLKRLTERLQRKEYLELSGHEIRIEVKKLNRSFLEYCATHNPRVHYILAKPEVSTLSEECLEAGLAHELSHAVREIESTQQGKREILSREYARRRLFREAEELAIDGDVIRRGLGKELYVFANWILCHRKKNGLFPEWNPEFGLHPDEIKRILEGTLKIPEFPALR